MAATNLPTSGRLPSRTTKFGVGRAMAPTVAALSAAACVPTLAIGLRSARASDRNPSLECSTARLYTAIDDHADFGWGSSIAISPRLSASLMAALGSARLWTQRGSHRQMGKPLVQASFVQPGAPTANPPSGEPVTSRQ